LTDPGHVAINALFLDPGISGGPETYLRGLVGGLREVASTCRFEVITTRRGTRRLREDGWDDVTELPCDEGDRGARAFAELVRLPRYARRGGADLIHSTASIGPFLTPGVAHVVTLHDVTHFRERTFDRVTTAGMKALMRGAARDADALITVSAAARDDIAATMRIDPARFAVIPHGMRPVGEAAPEDDVRALLGLESGVRPVVCVASKRPHKNQELLVRALALLPDGPPLVLAGHAEPYDALLRSLAAELGVEQRVVFAEQVDDPMLEGLWRLAAAAAFPTRGEGFGLPVVEAMLRGVPVACSNIPVLREVAAGHAELFGTDDTAGAAAAIERAIARGHDAAAIAAARVHAETFTWRRAAEQTFEVYRRACASA